jgi:hypothetical protein
MAAKASKPGVTPPFDRKRAAGQTGRQTAWQAVCAYLLSFVAGLLVLLSLAVLLFAGLIVFNLVFTFVNELARAQAAGRSPWGDGAASQLLAAVIDSARNLVNALWDMRLGFVIAGLLGVVALWGRQIGEQIYPQRVWWISFGFTATVIAAATVTWVFAQQALIADYIASSPELYQSRGWFEASHGTDIVVGLLISILLALPFWSFWQMFYLALETRFLPAGTPPGPHAATPENETTSVYATLRRDAERLHALKKGEAASAPAVQTGVAPQLENKRAFGWRSIAGVAALLLIVLLAALYLVRLYAGQVAVRMEHATVYVRAEATGDLGPEMIVPVHLGANLREIRVANINGEGSASISLAAPNDCRMPIASVDNWSFRRREGEYLHVSLPLEDVAPGDYCLRFVQHKGWAMFEYTISHGGGAISHQLAIFTGLLVAASLVLGMGLLAMILVGAGILAPRSPSRG